MRHLTYITCIVILLSSCKLNDKKDKPIVWTESHIKQYFIDSIGLVYRGGDDSESLNKFSRFMNTFYHNTKAININSSIVYALEEPYIDTTKIDTSKKWFRVIVEPTFSLPYCIVAEKINEKTKLTLKMTNGDGGYYSGYLDFTSTIYRDDSIYNSISKMLDKINYWKLNRLNDTTCPRVLDGQNWTFEAINKGKYNLVNRQSPYNCSSYEMKTLIEIVDSLNSVIDFKDYYNLKEKIRKKNLEED